MHSIKIHIPLLVLLVIACHPGEVQHNTLSKKEISDGWVLLFDGQSTEQWRNYLQDSLTGWGIEDESLKAPGLGGDMGGDIITMEQYENFELSLEWRISPGGN